MNRLQQWRDASREVAVAGLGASGVAATRLLAANGIKVYASDRSAEQGANATMLQGEGGGLVSAEAGRHDLERIAAAGALVLSPGIPPDVPVVRAARDAGVPVVAEAQLGLDALPGVRCIAVTGTNGKSTTTALVAAMLQAGGRSAVPSGNFGTPVCEVALQDDHPEWLALELSSFQLHDMDALAPAVGILTNLAPDHLDRYPDLDSYYADKARLFGAAGPGSVWVSNLDDPDSRTMVGSVAGRHLSFSLDARADGWYARDTGQLMLGDRVLIARDEFPLLGDHNVANALAAALAVHAVGVPIDALAGALRSFTALPHRMEPVGVFKGVEFINDSKATNVSSTRVALAAMDRPFVLLLGGRHKGEPYTSLASGLGNAVAVIAYGESAHLVEADLGPLTRVIRLQGFEESVRRAAAEAPEGGVVLLSPACSSYDQFDNYGERGREFARIASTL